MGSHLAVPCTGGRFLSARMSSPPPLIVRICPDKPAKQLHRQIFPADSPVLRVSDPNAPRKRYYDAANLDASRATLSNQRPRRAASARRVTFSEKHDQVFIYSKERDVDSPREHLSPHEDASLRCFDGGGAAGCVEHTTMPAITLILKGFSERCGAAAAATPAFDGQRV